VTYQNVTENHNENKSLIKLTVNTRFEKLVKLYLIRCFKAEILIYYCLNYHIKFFFSAGFSQHT